MNLKEFFEYLFNKFKFWFIVNEWEGAIHMRNGKLLRKLDAGLYFKLPIIDFVYSQAIRTKEIEINQTDVLSKDGKQITITPVIHYVINDVYAFYNNLVENYKTAIDEGDLAIFENELEIHGKDN